MPRTDEQIILFPALARPAGQGRWLAALRGVIFRPCDKSLRRRLLVRAIAKAAEVSESRLMVERLRRSVAPFLVDHCSRRRITVEVAGQQVELGPSGRDGHVHGKVEFAHAPQTSAIVAWSLCDSGCTAKAVPSVVHLIPSIGLSVICDIDDTIKHSCVPNARELLRNTFLRPAKCIAPVRSALLTFARAGAAVHYVSASPWQLFPALRAFMRRAGLPDGSFHLKEFRPKDRTALALLAPPERFKTPVIEGLLETWPERRFILMGDSAERDPEIYGEIARRRPRQVPGIVIRMIDGERVDARRWEPVPGGVVRVLSDDADWAAAAADVLHTL